MNEDKATRFQRLRRRAAVMAACWSVLLLVFLLVTDASIVLRNAIRHVLDSVWMPAMLLTPAVASVYAITIALVHEIGALPFAYFTGLVLERRYELSRQSSVEWARDYFKALAIGLVFVGAAAAFVYITIAVSPGYWWILSTAGAVIVSVVLTWLAPVILFPLFFRVVPLQNQNLRDRLAALAKRTGAPVTDVFEWRLSDRTSRANAALTGFGGTRRILVSDTLLGEYSDDEIEVVLAHELSHHRHLDLWRALALETIVVGAGLWAAARVLRAAMRAPEYAGAGDVAGLPMMMLTLMAVSVIALPLANAASRWHERRADRFALETTRNPEAFASAMRRLAVRNLAEEHPPVLARVFFYTHPPFAERIDAARRWADRQLKTS